MLIKYEYIGDRVIVNVPDSSYWEIRFKLFDDDTGVEDYNLYLIFGDKEFVLRDTDYWCQGRRDLPYRAVGALYEEIVDVIAQRIAEDPNLKFLDIEAIEAELIETKYQNKWLEKGYITLTADGSW